MKGIVFNLLEEAVTQKYGEDTWDDLLLSAGLDGAYTSLGSYSDADLLKIVAAASKALGLPPQSIVRWFGSAAVPILVRQFPGFFAPHSSTKSFVLTLNHVIHPEVRKLYPGADVPEFEFETPSENGVVIRYQSRRKLCAFAEGLIEGAAHHFHETAEIQQPTCMNRGDDQCTLVCTFTRK
jgi:hypothetical protein